MKHRFAKFAIVAVLLVSAFTFASVPTPTLAACTLVDAVGPSSGFYSVVPGHFHTVTYYELPSDTVGYTQPFIPKSSPAFYSVFSGFRIVIIDTESNCGGEAPLPLFTDGRENKNDAAQTAAVYCGVPNDGDVRVYALYNQKGYLAFTVTKAQLAAGVQKPASPYLIKSGMGAELWRLQDGSLRIKRGTYFFDWPGC
jgi:hypothetical protein